MTQESALLFGLFSAFMWGSWAITLTRLKDYPLDAFFLTLYVASFAVVWTIALLSLGRGVFTEIGDAWSVQPSIILLTLAAGALYILGVRISLTVFTSIGLTLTAPLQTTMNLGLGTFIAAWIGGVPAGISPIDLSVVCLIFLAASLAAIWAGVIRDKALAGGSTVSANPGTRLGRAVIIRNILLTALSSVLITAYPLGLSYGLRSPQRTVGLNPLPYMALLVTGSLVSAVVVSVTFLTLHRDWPKVFRAKLTVHRYALISAGAHYGGNIIHTFATGALTAAVAWPLGTTAALWTYLWGLWSGEFKGVPRGAWTLIAASMLFCLIGIFVLKRCLEGNC
jgi:hypothetical protein